MKINKRAIVLHILIFIILIINMCLTSVFIYKQLKYKDNNYYNENVLKVVEIACYDDIDNVSYGTGWFYDSTTIVTNYHVLSYISNGKRECFTNVEVRFYDCVEYEKVELFNYNEKDDIAILKYDEKHIHNIFKTNNKTFNSQKCYSIGNFSNYGLSYKEGYVSLNAVNLSYNNQYNSFIQCSITIGLGDSGAPLFNEQNEVIGMITFRTKNISGNVEQGFAYAIPIERIIKYTI